MRTKKRVVFRSTSAGRWERMDWDVLVEFNLEKGKTYSMTSQIGFAVLIQLNSTHNDGYILPPSCTRETDTPG